MRVQKEQSFQLNGLCTDRSQNALNVYYDEVIRSVVDALVGQLGSAQKLPRIDNPVPLVLSGGTAMPKGFVDRFTKILRAQEFPIRISEIRLAPDPLNSTARGALVAALV